MQSIRITITYTSLDNKEVEPVEPVLKNIYQSIITLSYLYFDEEPSVQEKRQMKD